MIKTGEVIQAGGRIREMGLEVVRFEAAPDVPEELVSQLIAKSRQRHIADSFEGPEDIGTDVKPGRFRTLEDYERWAEKMRTVYLLTNSAIRHASVPDVGAVMWFGESRNEHIDGRSLQDDFLGVRADWYQTTMAIRHYSDEVPEGTSDPNANNWQNYLGEGLGMPFMGATHIDYERLHPDQHFWLEVVESNFAKELYRKFGYVALEGHVKDPDEPGNPERNRLIMVRRSTASEASRLPEQADPTR